MVSRTPGDLTLESDFSVVIGLRRKYLEATWSLLSQHPELIAIVRDGQAEIRRLRQDYRRDETER